MKEYREIETFAGSTIEDAVNVLLKHKEKGELVFCKFNGYILYSDTVTMDLAYKKITGKNRSEFINEQKKIIDNFKRQEEEYKREIPKLTKMWIEKGRKILTKDKWELWDKIVPTRLNDLYRGMELGCCLSIVKILNNNCSLYEARKKIKSQGHSGMSFNLVCSMIKEFCDRGEEFVKYLKSIPENK